MAATVIADRVQETTATTGTGTVTLAGAVAQFQTFSAGIGDGNTTFYGITSGDGASWEVGTGVYTSAGNTLSRSPLASSSGGSAISLTGTSNVFCDAPAAKLSPAIVIPSQVQSASSHGTSPVTATLGAAPTVGNTLLFLVSGYTNGSANYFTPPAGVVQLAQQVQTNEGVAVFYRAVQSGDGTAWAFTSAANDFNVTVIELAGTNRIDIFTDDAGVNGSSSATNYAPYTSEFRSGHLFYAMFNIESATAATGTAGWTTLIFQGSGSHVQFITMRAFDGSQASATWTAGSTSQHVMIASVSVS